MWTMMIIETCVMGIVACVVVAGSMVACVRDRYTYLYGDVSKVLYHIS